MSSLSGTVCVQAPEIAERHGGTKLVLIASRRTDIPAFHADEIIGGLASGHLYFQVFYQGIRRLSFQPEDIHCVGLWSQNFAPWLKRREQIDRLPYRFWHRFTILPDDPFSKPKAPRLPEQIIQLEKLCRWQGRETIEICIDPLIVYRPLGRSTWLSNANFAQLAFLFERVGRLGFRAVKTSLVDYYRKVERRATKRGFEICFGSIDRQHLDPLLFEAAEHFFDLAGQFGLSVQTCCEPQLKGCKGAEPSGCVDGEKLNKLFGPGASICPDTGQRRKNGCLCTKALDIGRYLENGEFGHHCGHDCPQCYARP